MFGISLGPYSVAAGSDTRPTNTSEDMQKLLDALRNTRAANATPNGRVARGFTQFGPQPSGPVAPMLPTPPTPGPVNMGPPATAQAPPPALSTQYPMPAPPPPAAAPAVTTPTPAPNPYADIPPDYGQAKNIRIGNYVMPAFGPAPNSTVSGPDVINKLLALFKDKASTT